MRYPPKDGFIERIVSALERTIDSHRRPTFTEHSDALCKLIDKAKESGVQRLEESSFMGPTFIISFVGDETVKFKEKSKTAQDD